MSFTLQKKQVSSFVLFKIKHHMWHCVTVFLFFLHNILIFYPFKTDIFVEEVEIGLIFILNVLYSFLSRRELSLGGEYYENRVYGRRAFSSNSSIKENDCNSARDHQLSYRCICTKSSKTKIAKEL